MKVQVYSNKKEPGITAKLVSEDEKFGTVMLEYLTGDNAGKTTQISKATLKRWWTVKGEEEIAEPVADEPAPKKEEEFLTKVTPKTKKQKAIKINKQEKIDYINMLCNRLGVVAIAKVTHPDALRIKSSTEKGATSYGEIKINHNSFVIYTARVIIVDDKKFGCVVDKDPTGRAKIKFNLEDAALEYGLTQLVESEAKSNGKN